MAKKGVIINGKRLQHLQFSDIILLSHNLQKLQVYIERWDCGEYQKQKLKIMNNMEEPDYILNENRHTHLKNTCNS